jgi:predicted nucleic acid-binding protein
MPIVSNTSPILNLAVVNHLHLLPRQFEEVLIPAEVLVELKPDSGYPGVAGIQQAQSDGWLRVVALSNIHLAQALTLELDQGEAAAIALALQLGHNRVLMDERDGRAKAKSLGLVPTGLLGVLLRAKLAGQIPSLKNVMQALRHEAGFFIDTNLFDRLLIEAGEG